MCELNEYFLFAVILVTLTMESSVLQSSVKCTCLMGQDKVEAHVQLNGEFIMLYHVFLRSSHMNIYLYNIIYMLILRVMRFI